MSKPQPQKTLADFAAIAIAPLLIMLLVGSLVFFLTEVTYHGQHAGRLRWILFWFVMASVLVSRIGIEQGTRLAATYGIALAVVTTIVILKFLESYVFGAISLLGVIWWCTNKLTWDCTLIDESEDASGQGLLQVSGLHRDAGSDKDDDGTVAKPSLSESTGSAGPAESEKHSVTSDQHPAETGRGKPVPGNPKTRNGRPHAPGVWIVYFSLAALPLFGVGQLLIPVENVASRQMAFRYLWVYVAAGLALLVTTSFLGLRRYLRQRRMKMPTAVTATWLSMGGGLILVILLICMALPRPHANYSLDQLAEKFGKKISKASRFAFLEEDAGKGDGKRTGKSGEGKSVDPGKSGGGNAGKENEKGDGGGKSKPGSNKGKGKAKKGSSKQRGKGNSGKEKQKNAKRKEKGGNQSARRKRTDGKRRKQENDKQKKDGKENANGPQQDAEQQPEENSSTSNSGPSGSWLGKIFKWIVYAVIAAVVIVLLIKNRRQILEGIRRFLQDLRNFFARLFSRQERAASASGHFPNGETKGRTPPPFASFTNPFVSGTAYQTSPRTMIVYTFAAMESWGHERGVARKAEQTPLEFAHEIGDQVPEMSRDAAHVSQLYTRANYAKTPPENDCLRILEHAWKRMQADPVVTSMP